VSPTPPSDRIGNLSAGPRVWNVGDGEYLHLSLLICKGRRTISRTRAVEIKWGSTVKMLHYARRVPVSLGLIHFLIVENLGDRYNTCPDGKSPEASGL
jgi:hypothetical protein